MAKSLPTGKSFPVASSLSAATSLLAANLPLAKRSFLPKDPSKRSFFLSTVVEDHIREMENEGNEREEGLFVEDNLREMGEEASKRDQGLASNLGEDNVEEYEEDEGQGSNEGTVQRHAGVRKGGFRCDSCRIVYVNHRMYLKCKEQCEKIGTAFTCPDCGKRSKKTQENLSWCVSETIRDAVTRLPQIRGPSSDAENVERLSTATKFWEIT